ncbi:MULTISPECIES: hypothetical protein [unclassified Janthinobacterium]|uniref:hypothetical protein n=1 Tax=unclassified Janthinobacterium TaxID=2610881 RepID=UPI00087534FB|nr:MULTISPECIES: hypothetical protein [unclassified Janthinobacterium]OEZ89178.1 hypothetical protein JAB8_27630 [Janthinobacterium sp. HH106]PHV38703.1 hypothetical protein CSQ95_12885 [Janthinobacterium sp. BJB304]
MKKIAAFIFTLGLSASYAMASDIGCSTCEEELRECTMQNGDRSPFCIGSYKACLRVCDIAS